jgi:2-polyprenyl-6-methoxyphenol hydroxylase-like FAD-dependent oxidoreductase
MTLALELAHHGVRSMIVERHAYTTRYPKMDLTNGRSMELYRRLGLVERIRAAGVDAENPFDIIWATSPSGHLLHRFVYPSPAQKRKTVEAANDGSGTSEQGLRISQIILEPILKDACVTNPLIEFKEGCQLESLTQSESEVISKISDQSGNVETVASRYLAGCDGGRSRVKRELAIDHVGHLSVARLYMIHFTSNDRHVLNPWGITWHFQTAFGTLIAQDDKDTWTLHVLLAPDTDESALDPDETLRTFAGRTFDYKILQANPWSPHMVVAERYREGRVFLAGDAAHQIIPAGGYGMNSGVGDAVDLGWKLAAVENGWGGGALLESYEAERRPIAVQNQQASELNWVTRKIIQDAIEKGEADGLLDDAGPLAAARRSALGEVIASTGNAENECWGIEHGYRYSASPIVAEEAGSPPPFDRLICVPTTWPGARLPHVRLADGRSLQDTLGGAFTLLSIGGGACGAFSETAAGLGLPLDVVELADEPPLAILEKKLLLVRPDQHVAWRGDFPPDDIHALLRLVSGWQT